MGTVRSEKKFRSRSGLNLSTALPVLAGYALLGLGGEDAIAQTAAPTPLAHTYLDRNGVNIATGQIAMSTPSISVGAPNGPSLQFNEVFAGQAVFHPYSFYLSTSGSGAKLTLGGSNDSFTLSGSSYSPSNGNGATLAAITGGYLYTMVDGTTVTFSSSLIGGVTAYYNGGTVQAVATSLTRPDGETITFTYKQQTETGPIPGGGSGTMNYVRLQSVNSNAGYQVKIGYGLSSMTTSSDAPVWMRISSAKAINNATDYCAPSGDSCTGLTQAWPSLGLTYTASGSNTLVGATDPVGAVTTITLDSNSRPVAYREAGQSGDAISVTYDSNGLVSAVVNHGVTYGYSFGAVLNVQYETLSSGGNTLESTESSTVTGQVVQTTDAFSNTTSYVNDSFGRITSVTYPAGNAAQYSYDTRGNLLTETLVPKANSGLSNVTYTATYPSSCTNALTCNKPTSTVDPAGNSTSYTYYSSTGLLNIVTAPANASGIHPQTRYTYTSLNAFYNTGSGVVSSGQPIRLLTGVSSCLTSASCSGAAEEVKTTISYGPQVTGTANNLWPVSILHAAGDNSVSSSKGISYDPIGNISSTDGPLSGTGDTTVYHYDADRRLTGIVQPDPDGAGSLTPSATRLTYAANGLITTKEAGTVTDQSGTAWTAFSPVQAVTTTFDSNDRQIQTSVSSGSTTYAVSQYSYDSLGRLNCQAVRMNSAIFGSLPSDPCTLGSQGSYGPDRIVKYTYDTGGRITLLQNGYGTNSLVSEATSYTASGKILSVDDADNNLTSYTYDGLDRLVKTSFPVLSQGAQASNASDYIQLTYDSYNRISQKRLRDGNTVSYTYDSLDRVSHAGGTTVAARDFTYNLQGWPLAATFTTGGQSVAHTYDALGRVTSEGSPQGSVALQYDAAGNLTRITWPDSFYVTYDYNNNNGAVTAVRENGATSGIGVLATFSYDSLGRRTSVVYGNGSTRTYGWDPVSRLAGIKLNFAGTADDELIGSAGGTGTAISYSPASQITGAVRSNSAYTWTSGYNVTRSYTANGLNQYTASGGNSITYDALGNLATSGGYTYAYNGLNQLTSVSGPLSATLSYDPADRLYQYVTGGTTTRFLYNGASPIAEYSGSNTLIRRYVPGPGADETIVWYEGTGTSSRNFLQSDERGSVIGISDSSGAVIAKNTYDEFGIPGTWSLAANGRFGYTGQMYLPEIGLWSYKARMYSSTLGRFMQTDPAGYSDGLNWYNYVHSDPINGTDPSGLSGPVPAPGCASSGGAAVYCGNIADPSFSEAEILVVGNPPCHYQPACSVTGQLLPPSTSFQLGLGAVLGIAPSVNAKQKSAPHEVPCSSLPSFRDAVSDPSFKKVLSEAAAQTSRNKWEYSFVYGPTLYLGPNTFSSPGTLGIADTSNSAGTFLVPSPAISFHTHFDAADQLSPADIQSAGDYPTAEFDIDRGKFRCAARTGG